jgi:hypothetical protein
MVLQEETTFPNPPTVGRIVYKDLRVWICAEIVSGVPAWVPLTPVNNTHVQDFSTSTVWIVTHNLNNMTPLVQIYDITGSMIIPENVIPSTNDVTIINFSSPVSGRAIVMFGDISVYPLS